MKLCDIIHPRFTASMTKLLSLKEVPASTKFKLRPIAKRIREASEDYNITRGEIVTEYATKDEKGKIIYVDKDIVKFPDDKLQTVNKALRDLANTEIELKTISYSELGPNAQELDASEIANLEFITE